MNPQISELKNKINLFYNFILISGIHFIYLFVGFQR